MRSRAGAWVLQLLRDGDVLANGSNTDELAPYQDEVELEPDRYRLKALVSDGAHTAELSIGDPLPIALFHHVEIDGVQDLDSDGWPEAIVLDFTGGAHCCFNYHIFASEPNRVRELDALTLGNGSIQRVEDLDGDGLSEIVASDDRLALVAGLAMATAPFLPIVLCQPQEGVFRDCTTRFPALVEESAAYYEPEMTRAESDQTSRLAAAIGVYAHYARLGREQDGLYWIASRYLECLRFVEQHRAEIDARLRESCPVHLGTSP